MKKELRGKYKERRKQLRVVCKEFKLDVIFRCKNRDVIETENKNDEFKREVRNGNLRQWKE